MATSLSLTSKQVARARMIIDGCMTKRPELSHNRGGRPDHADAGLPLLTIDSGGADTPDFHRKLKLFPLVWEDQAHVNRGTVMEMIGFICLA